MLIPSVHGAHSRLWLPHPLPQPINSHSKTHTISSYLFNFTSHSQDDEPHGLLNPFPPPPNPVQIRTVQSSVPSINVNTYGLSQATAATYDSTLFSHHVSPSLNLSNIRPRTTTFKPLPTALPPVPCLSSSSYSPPVKKSSVNTLRSNYTKMLSKKSSATMPPPPSPSVPQSSTMFSMEMETQMDLDKFMEQSEDDVALYDDLVPAAEGGARMSVAVPSGIFSHHNSHADKCGYCLSAVVQSPAIASGDSGIFGLGSRSAMDLCGAGGGDPAAVSDMTMDDLLQYLNTPPTPSLHNPPPTPLSSSSFTSPFFDQDDYIRSLNTPASDPLAFFGVSPDVVSQASPYQTSPALALLDDLDISNQPLFFDASLSMTMSSSQALSSSYAPPTTKQPTVSPTALGLSTVSRHTSWEGSSAATGSTSSVSPQPHSDSLPPASSRSPTSPSSTGPAPNGIRKNVKLTDLVPVSAPIQPRNYITPSATSRREVPPSVARTFVPTSSSRKRSAASAGLAASEEMQDELAEEDENDEDIQRKRKEREGMDPEKRALLEHVEASRKRNTLAARKSRARKLEHVRGLEEIVERLQAENEALRSRVEVCESRLRDAGLDAS